MHWVSTALLAYLFKIFIFILHSRKNLLTVVECRYVQTCFRVGGVAGYNTFIPQAAINITATDDRPAQMVALPPE